jgi:hypothetical protein
MFYGWTARSFSGGFHCRVPYCALLFVRKHSLGTSWSKSWPRTWYSTRRSVGDTDTITSETGYLIDHEAL